MKAPEPVLLAAAIAWTIVVLGVFALLIEAHMKGIKSKLKKLGALTGSLIVFAAATMSFARTMGHVKNGSRRIHKAANGVLPNRSKERQAA